MADSAEFYRQVEDAYDSDMGDEWSGGEGEAEFTMAHGPDPREATIGDRPDCSMGECADEDAADELKRCLAEATEPDVDASGDCNPSSSCSHGSGPASASDRSARFCGADSGAPHKDRDAQRALPPPPRGIHVLSGCVTDSGPVDVWCKNEEWCTIKGGKHNERCDADGNREYPCKASSADERLFPCIACNIVRHEACFTPKATKAGPKWCCGTCMEESDLYKANALAKANKRGKGKGKGKGKGTRGTGKRRARAAGPEEAKAWSVDSLPTNTRFTPTPLPTRTNMYREGHSAVNLPPDLRHKQRAKTLRPLDLFLFFIPLTLIKTMVANTNAYARLHKATARARKWVDVTVSDILRFFAIIIHHGLVRVPSHEMFWNNNVCTFHASTVMSLTRFQQIKRFFHVAEPDPPLTLEQLAERRAAGRRRDPDAGDTGDSSELPSYARKVLPLMEQVRTACMSLLYPGKNVAIDEVIVRFTGRSTHTFVIKHKPNPCGYKIYALCDSSTGYVYNFKVTSARKAVVVQFEHVKEEWGFTATEKYVAELTLSLRHRGHSVFMDNFFSSTRLFAKLHELGYHCTGTARPLLGDNRVPSTVKVPKQHRNKVPHNTLAVDIGGGGTVARIMWFDNGPVYFLTTEFDTDAWEDVERRRPRKTQNTPRTTLAAWGDSVLKVMKKALVAIKYNL